MIRLFFFCFLLNCFALHAGTVFNVKKLGAKGDGSTDDWEVIEKAITVAPAGSTIYFPKGIYIVKYALSLKSNISYIGEDKEFTILKSSPESIDNILGRAYPLYLYWEKARKANGTIDRLKKPDFKTNYSEDDVLINGGMAGFAVINVRIENLTFDGNKDSVTENKVNLRGTGNKKFFAGEKITCKSGASAVISGVFADGDGFSVEPRTITGAFRIGDLVQGSQSGAEMVITDKRADDAYQMLVRFDAVSNSVIKNCIFRNSVFTALSIYNASNGNLITGNLFYNNNKAKTDYLWGRMNIFIEFDARNNTVENNVVNGGLGYSIFVQSTGGANYNTKILNNIVLYPAADGIRVGNESGISPIYNVVISGNVVRNLRGEGSVGIRVIHYGEGAIDGVKIFDNTVVDCIYGILLQGRVENSQVYKNKVTKCKNNGVLNASVLTENRIYNNTVE